MDEELRARLGAAAEVVAALDQRQVTVGSQTWVLEVLGVHHIGADLWVQVTRRCCPDESLLLRLAPGTTAEEVLKALAWTTPCESFPHVIKVTSTQAHRCCQ